VTASLAGPVPLSRVWTGTKVLAEDLAGEDLADVLDLHAGAMAWWVLDRSSAYGQEELRRLAKALDLDDLAVTDLTAEDQRTKFEQLGQARLVVTSVIGPSGAYDPLPLQPISLLVTNRALIVLADPGPAINPARLLATHADRLAEHGIEAAVQAILEVVVAGYGTAVERLEAAADEISSHLFEERPLTKAEQLSAFRLRSRLSELRRLTEPMRSITADLRLSSEDGDSAVGRQWRMIEEEHGRAANAAERLREELASVFETSLALADVQLNVIMKKLSGWAAIIAVPTLVTSFVGMNVGYPLAGTHIGFWVYLTIMIIVTVVLFVMFRRKGWI
jgi:magnesium transporter